jgi:AcrR family transcriptional regulator
MTTSSDGRAMSGRPQVRSALPDPDSPVGPGSAASNPADGSTGSGLDRRKVLQAAVTLVDHHELRYLTMRRLGQQLGVEAMSLYHYVYSREDLLDGMVELVIDDLYGDPNVQLTAHDWREYLQRLAHGVRRTAIAHPQLFPLIATRPPAAPWVRPPLRSLRWMESFLETLHECGFDDSAAVSAYRSFSSFLLGHLLLEVSALGADIGPIEQSATGAPVQTDLTEYPRLKTLEHELSQDHSAEEFQDALDTLLDRLLRRVGES